MVPVWHIMSCMSENIMIENDSAGFQFWEVLSNRWHLSNRASCSSIDYDSQSVYSNYWRKSLGEGVIRILAYSYPLSGGSCTSVVLNLPLSWRGCKEANKLCDQNSRRTWATCPAPPPPPLQEHPDDICSLLLTSEYERPTPAVSGKKMEHEPRAEEGD